MSHVDFKIVLLGNQGVGKSCIFTRYLHSTFNNTNKTTLGAVFGSKYVTSGGNKFSIGIWDTAGSERYYAMTKQFYRGAKAAIVCFDPSDVESWNRVTFWVKDLLNVEELCKIYVCSTKKDLVDDGSIKWTVDKYDVIDFVDDLPYQYFNVSSKTGEGIDDLFQKIVDNCGADPQLLQRIAAEKAIRKAELDKNYQPTDTTYYNKCC